MAIEGNDDLRLDLEVGQFDDYNSKLQRAEDLALGFVKSINKSTESTTQFSSKASRELLQLDKTAKTLTDTFLKLGKKSGLEQFQGEVINSIEELLQLQSVIQRLDEQTSLNIPISEGDKADLREVINRLNEIKRISSQIGQVGAFRSARPDIDVSGKVGIDSQISRQLFSRQKSVQELELQFEKLGQKISSNKVFDVYNSDLIELRKNLVIAKEKFDSLQAKLKTVTVKSELDELKEDSRKATIQLEELRRAYSKLQFQVRSTNAPKTPVNNNNKNNNFGQVLQGVGLPYFAQGLSIAAPIAATFYGIERFIRLSDKLLEKASEEIRVNRLLASAATEAGLAYETLSEKRDRFAEKALLSDVRATAPTAKIAQLASRAGKPEDLDKLIKGFLDLGAARGLNPTELETIIQQIITGQDEGYKKLLLPNPSLLYQRYAKSQGRTTGDLSALERSQITNEEFLKKASLFSGSAEARINSLEGRVAKLSSSYENLTFKISTYAATTQFATDVINSLTNSTASLNKELDKLNSKTTNTTVNEIVEKYGSEGGFYRGLKALGSTVGLVPGISSGIGDALTFGKTPLNDIKSNLFLDFVNSVGGYNSIEYENELRRQVLAQKKFLADQDKIREEVKKQIDEENQLEENRRKFTSRERFFERELKNPRKSIDELRQLKSDFINETANIDERILSPDEQSEKLIGFDKAVSNRVAKDFRLFISDVKNGFNELRAIRSSIQNSPDLFAEDQEQLIQQVDNKLEGLKQKILGVREDVASFLNQQFSKNNPLVNLMTDFETAVIRARKRFSSAFGDKFADQLAELERKQIQIQINQEKFTNQKQILEYTQAARRLEAIPETETNGFQRRLGFIKDTISSVIDISQLTRDIQETDFYSTKYNRFIPDRNFAVDQFGYAGVERLIQGLGPDSLQRTIELKNSIEDIGKLNLIDTEGTGIYGAGIVSEKILQVVPPLQELIDRLNNPNISPEQREEARSLISSRYTALRNVREFREQQFSDLIENQKVAERARRDAQEQVDLVNRSTGLEQLFAAQQVLSITSQLGTSELTPVLRNAAIQANRIAAAAIEEREKQAAKDVANMKEILDHLDEIITKQGIKIDVDRPLIDVNINNLTDFPVTGSRRASNDDVKNANL